MPIGDLSTTKQFVSGQLGVDGPDLNAIIGQASIQPAFYSAQSTGSSAGDSDYLLLLSSGNTFYKLLYQNFFNTNRVRLAAQVPQYVATINGAMEVWQRQITWTAPVNSTPLADRYKIFYILGGGGVPNASQVALSGSLVENTTGFKPAFGLRITVGTAQASLAAGDIFYVAQRVEYRNARKLIYNPHSLQVWVRSSVAGTFAVFMQDSVQGQTFKQDFNVGTPNTWQRLTLPNIPAVPGGGNWGTNETDFSYVIGITLACGSTFQSATNGSWISGNFAGSSSQTNLFATLNATFDICLLQHESGPVCTAFQPDDDFSETLNKCKRFYQKSYAYGVFAGSTSSQNTDLFFPAISAAFAVGQYSFSVPMRVIPTITTYAGSNNGTSGSIWDQAASVTRTVTTIAAENSGISFLNTTVTAAASGFVGSARFNYVADAEL